MINEFEINSQEINHTSLESVTDSSYKYSSFGTEITGKFAYLGEYGQIFNFDNLCMQLYGNAGSTSQNFYDLADINLEYFETPLQNGGILQNKRFSQKNFSIKLLITSDTIEHLEQEIQTMKSVFNGKGQLYRNIRNREEVINVILTDFKINGAFKSIGIEVDINFLSLDPFWRDRQGSTKSFENLTVPLFGTLLITDSDYSPMLTSILQIKTISESINYIELEFDGYVIRIDREIKNGDIIIFDGEKTQVLINGESIFYKGQFIEFPVASPRPVKINYTGLMNYNFYVLYNKIAL